MKITVERTDSKSRRGPAAVRAALANDIEAKSREVERLMREAERCPDPGKAKLAKLCAEHAVRELDAMGDLAKSYQRLR